MTVDKKILLSTVYRRHKNDVYDYFGANARRSVFRFSVKRVNSFGLRFLKQNIPEIEIIEYPSWEEYVTKLNEEDWDVVGFSFYLNEIHEILEMVEFARAKGIKEIWAGNYGALTESIEKHFDRMFIGYAENEVAQYLGKNLPNGRLIHPPLIGNVSTLNRIKVDCLGFLFTNRGCTMNCDFCQTPPFCKKPSIIPLQSIENVLRYYHKLGINEIVIPDESFGLFRSHSENVVNLLDKYGFYWMAMVRADYLSKNLNDWVKKGLKGVLIGIESFNQMTLDSIHKKESVEEINSVIKRLKEMNLFINGLFMIGFENETVESIKRDYKKLAKFKMDITQICINTPLPRTPQWDYIEKKYGIFDKDWHHYNTKHLVWNHPNISPKEMIDVLNLGFRIAYPRTRPMGVAYNFLKRYIGDRGVTGGTKYLIENFIHSNRFNYHPEKMHMLPINGFDKILKESPSNADSSPNPT